MKPRTALRVAVAGIIGRRRMGLLRRNPDTVLCALIDPMRQARLLAAEGVPYYASRGG